MIAIQPSAGAWVPIRPVSDCKHCDTCIAGDAGSFVLHLQREESIWFCEAARDVLQLLVDIRIYLPHGHLRYVEAHQKYPV